MSKVILYHGRPDEIVDPVFGLGNSRHDYGKGFHLTEDLTLAKEWAVSRPETVSGFVHTFEIETDGLDIFDFQDKTYFVGLQSL